MPNSEDYLDGLLESISQAKTESSHTAELREKKQNEKIAERNRISSDDDFMKATGLSDYKPEKVTHKNLREAFSEKDFLKEFESELNQEINLDTADDYISEFEKELNQDLIQGTNSDEDIDFDEQNESDVDSLEVDTDTLEDFAADSSGLASNEPDLADQKISENQLSEDNGDLDAAWDDDVDISSDLDALEQVVADKNSAGDEEPEFEPADSVDDILSNAMLAMDDQLNTAKEESAENEFLQEEFRPDEMDATDELPLDELDLPGDDFGEPLLDENDENVDLMSMLGNDESGELSDIGDLLNADESGQELDESRNQFEAAAKKSEAGIKDSDAEGTDKKEKKGLVAKIKEFFASLLSDDDEDDNTVIVKENEGITDTSEENENLLKEFEGQDIAELDKKAQKKLEKEQKKKEKEEQKKIKDQEKEAKKKETDAKKQEQAAEKQAKKEAKAAEKAAKKAADRTPRIPLKVIIVFVIFAISIAAFILIFTNIVGYNTAIDKAKTDYQNGDYITAYNDINGVNIKSDDDELYQQIHMLATLQQKYKSYQSLWSSGQYEMALDQLILAHGAYLDNMDEAEALGISEVYGNLDSLIINDLSTNFGVTDSEAYELYNMEDRTDYTWAIRYLLIQKGLETDGSLDDIGYDVSDSSSDVTDEELMTDTDGNIDPSMDSEAVDESGETLDSDFVDESEDMGDANTSEDISDVEITE